jgi:hypothetical protein
VTVTGLTPTVTYVVFCWFRVERTREDGSCPPANLTIIVDETNVVATKTVSFSNLKASFR